MGRRPEGPWKRRWRPGHWAKIQGRLHHFETEDFAEAHRQWCRLMGRPAEERDAATGDDDPFVAELLQAYVLHLRATNSPYVVWYRSRLKQFIDGIGRRLLLSELRPRMVSEWLATTDLAPTTRASYATAVQTALNWCVLEGLCTATPLGKIRKPARERREFLWRPWQTMLLLAALDEWAQPLVALIAGTGVRPSKLFQADGRHVAADGSKIVLGGQHGKKRGRTIYVPPSLRPLVQRLAKEAGTDGILCPTQRGRRWTKFSLARAIQEARDAVNDIAKPRKPLPAGATAYAFRHTWITARLREGVAVALVAEMTGTSIAMISENYAHLDDYDLGDVADRLP